MSSTDLRVFAKLGFLVKVSQKPSNYANDVCEQIIHDAVESDFEMPQLGSQSPTVQAIFNAPLIGSNVNVSQHMEQIVQSIDSISTLSELDKARFQEKIRRISEALTPFEQTHDQEVREVTRSLDLVIGDLAESEPDKENIVADVVRLRRVAEKLFFAPIAMTLVSELVEHVLQILG